MAFFQWQQIDPEPAEVRQALADAFVSAELSTAIEEEFNKVALCLEESVGSLALGDLLPPPDQARRSLRRVVISWWTDAVGRRHWYIEGDRYHHHSEPDPLWRCRYGKPIHPLWVIAPHQVVEQGEGPDRVLLVVCDCGEVGTPESLGWMGTCCGPCHDRLTEGDWTEPPPRAFHPHRSSVTGLAFLEDGRLASCGSRDTEPCVRDFQSRREIRFPHLVDGGLAGLVVLPDDRLVVALTSGLVVCWDVNTGENLWQTECPGELMGIAASPLGDQIAVDAVSQTYLLDGDTGEGTGLSDDYSHFAYSFDSDVLYAFDYDPRAIVAIDPITEEASETGLAFGEPEEDDCYSSACPPSRRLIASGGDHGRVRLGDPEAGRWLWIHDGPPGLVSQLAFTPDGLILVSGHKDAVIFWETESGRRVGLLRIPGYRVGAMAFSGDGATLAVGNEQGVVRLLPWRQLLKREV